MLIWTSASLIRKRKARRAFVGLVLGLSASARIGDALKGGDAGIVVDEAHLDISVPHTPLYFVLGKRMAAAPFPEVAVAQADSWILSGVSSPAGEAWVYVRLGLDF